MSKVVRYFPENFRMLEEWAKENRFLMYEREKETLFQKFDTYVAIENNEILETPYRYLIRIIKKRYERLQ